MIINKQYTEAVVSAEVEVYSGGIAFNAEMFDIIISGIYRDKELAACREPIFNAFDAHVEADRRDYPIYIHSPTTLEPWFSVRDTGPGMSKEMVTKLFMTMGESTKRMRNDQVGAKGIGSKAPYAYTDMFTVVSVYNGEKTVYSLYKSKGMPKISPLSSTPTDEPNGVEVKFSVEPEQVHAFRQRIRKALTHVKSPYEVNDPYLRDMIADSKPDCFHSRETEGWRVEFYRNGKSEDNVVVMGQQSYTSETLSKYPPCAVFVNIGDCNVSPGREYTEEGEDDAEFVAKLERIIEEATNEIGEDIVKALEKTKNIIEAREYFKTTPSSYFVTRYGIQWLRDKVAELTLSDKYMTTSSYKKTKHGRVGCVKDYDTGLTSIGLLNGDAVSLYVDKNSALRRKALHLLKEYEAERVWLVFPDDIGAALATSEYFAPMFIMATSLNPPKPEKIKTSRSGNIRICVLERDGEGYEEWVNKDALAEVEYYMVKGTKQQGDTTWMGEFNRAKEPMGRQFDNLGVTDDKIYLITEGVTHHLPKSAVRVTSETWVKNTKASHRKWFLRRHLGFQVYQAKSQLEKVFGIKTLPLAKTDDEWEFEFGSWGRGSRLHDNSEYSVVKMKIENRYVARVERLKQEALKKYPLVKLVGFNHWADPEVVEYRELIDAKEKNNEVC